MGLYYCYKEVDKMDYLKPQYEYLKGRLKGKEKEYHICYESLHERSGVLTNEYFMFIPADKRFVRENTIREPYNVTALCANYDYRSKVSIDNVITNYDKKLQVVFSNGTKANKKFIDLFEGCEFYNDGKTKPIYCILEDELVGVVMPMR